MWGKYAIHGSGAISNLNRDNLNICVLRFVKISVFEDRSVSTAYDVSEVLIKPEMVEAEAFLKLLNKHDTHINLLPWNPVCLLPEIGEKINFFTPVPMKTISEVFETKKAERCIVYCSIAAIDYDINWYYMSCKCCGQKVPSPPRYLMLYGNNLGDDSEKYYCSNCDMFGPELQPRYNIQLVVLDNTRDTNFLLLDRIAEKVLGVPCHALTGPLTDEGTHKTIETEYSAQNGNQNKYTDVQQLGYSENPTKFIYDGQLKAWKKRSGYRKAPRSSLTKKFKTDKSG
ncbi:uncharacterized protein LOC108835619 [Raphanus sativus]|uniref:Uncharacterized protein LOC108835619 n=1 Tax=Raphanus sativus TaxID=3726 RepID=A0A6J0LVZ3_RAPSA|nr:uncharacterized protein LOC108835619 [Raphanus sativus]